MKKIMVVFTVAVGLFASTAGLAFASDALLSPDRNPPVIVLVPPDPYLPIIKIVPPDPYRH